MTDKLDSIYSAIESWLKKVGKYFSGSRLLLLPVACKDELVPLCKTSSSVNTNGLAIQSAIPLVYKPVRPDQLKEKSWQRICSHFKIRLIQPVLMDGVPLAYLCLVNSNNQVSDPEAERLRQLSAPLVPMLLAANELSGGQTYSEKLHRMLSELSRLHEMSRTIESRANLDSLLEYIMQRCMELINAEAASLMLVDEKAQELEFKIVLGPKAQEVKPFRLPIGKGITGWVAKTGQPLLIPDAYKDDRFDSSFDKRSGFVTRSILCVPMVHESKTIGVMNVLNPLEGKSFTEDDQMLLLIYASQAALSIENVRLLQAVLEKERMDKELQTAAEIQQMLLPAELPKLHGLDVSACYIPCREVSGDFYDIIKLDENSVACVVADVAGKGVPSAMLVATMQASLQAYLESSSDVLEIVTRLNRNLIQRTAKDRFITFFMMILDLRSGRFTYINAGHNPPLLLKQNETIEELRSGGLFLGYIETDFEIGTGILRRGELLVLYTDGLVEAMNKRDQDFGERRLIDEIKKSSGKNAPEIEKSIIAKVHDHIGSRPLDDDFTLVVIKKK